MQVFQLVYRQIKELAKAPLIHVAPLIQREHHVLREDNGRVSGQDVVGDGSCLFAQLQPRSSAARCLLNDGRAQEQRELAPMDGAEVQETVEETPLEHRLERNEEDCHDRKAAQLVSITAPQDLADMELSKESLNLGRSSFTGMMMMWYNIHSISPPVLLWIFGYFHYTKWR